MGQPFHGFGALPFALASGAVESFCSLVRSTPATNNRPIDDLPTTKRTNLFVRHFHRSLHLIQFNLGCIGNACLAWNASRIGSDFSEIHLDIT